MSSFLKTLKSVKLGACKSISGCSSKTCDESACVDLGLKIRKTWRVLHKLNWFYKVLQMPSFRLSVFYFGMLLNVEVVQGCYFFICACVSIAQIEYCY